MKKKSVSENSTKYTVKQILCIDTDDCETLSYVNKCTLYAPVLFQQLKKVFRHLSQHFFCTDKMLKQVT